MVDGNGILHPKRFGTASHLGVCANLRTIGVGKSLHCFGDLSRAKVKSMLATEPRQEHLMEAIFKYWYLREDGVILGAAVLPTRTTANPIFLSIGHRISFKKQCLRLPPLARTSACRNLCAKLTCEAAKCCDYLNYTANIFLYGNASVSFIGYPVIVSTSLRLSGLQLLLVRSLGIRTAFMRSRRFDL